MEYVNEFTKELNSLFEARPPVSKAKMTAITKAAIKAVRMYKHVVQAVEKFILKCQAHYKIPGLYVIDSIVRQSRHQFGADKDVYGPRFSRNFQTTFQNLFTTCNNDDKPRIVRVLNLWMKNNTFNPEVIEPLLDLANPNLSVQSGSSSAGFGTASEAVSASSKGQTPDQPASKHHHRHHQHSSSNEPGGNNHLLGSSLMSALSSNNSDDPEQNRNLMQQLQQLASVLSTTNANSNIPGISNQLNNQNQPSSSSAIQINKDVLAFDYGDDDDDDMRGDTPTESEPQTSSLNKSGHEDPHSSATPLALSMAQNLLSNPDLLKKLQMIGGPSSHDYSQNQHSLHQSQLLSSSDLQASLSYQGSLNDRLQAEANSLSYQQQQSLSSLYRGQTDRNSFMSDINTALNRIQNSSFTSPNGGSVAESCSQPLYVNNQPNNDEAHNLRYDAHASMHSGTNVSGIFQSQFSNAQSSNMGADSSGVAGDSRQFAFQPNEKQQSQGYDDNESRDRDHRGRRGSPGRGYARDRFSQRSGRRSRSRSPNRGGSRWSDRASGRSPKSRFDRRRSPSPTEKERDRERERRRKGLPPIRSSHLTICSTTLWLGHVPKLTSEADLSDHFGEFGTVTSIDLIPPRGCAYVCMDRRQDAYRALQDLKNMKLHGSIIKMAWAPGKGMKGKEYKDYWEVDVGASYIPYNKLSNDVDLETLEEGGMIDEETVPEHLQEIRRQKALEKAEKAKQEAALAAGTTPIPPVPPNPFAVPGLMVSTAVPPVIGSSAPLVFPDPSAVTVPSSMDPTLISYPHLKPNNAQNETAHPNESKDAHLPMGNSSSINPTASVPPTDVPPVPNLFQHPPPPIGLPPHPPPPGLLASQNPSWLRGPPPAPPSLLPGPPPPLGALPPPVSGPPPLNIPPAATGHSPNFESPIKVGANASYPQRANFNEGFNRQSPIGDDPFAPSLYELRAMERSNVVRPPQGLLPPPGPPLRGFREDQQSRPFDNRAPQNRDWRNQGGGNFDRRGRGDDRRNRGQEWNRRDNRNSGGAQQGRGGDRDNRDRYNRSGFNNNNRRDSGSSNKRERGSRWESSEKDRRGQNDENKKNEIQENSQDNGVDTNSGFYIPPVEPGEKQEDKGANHDQSDQSSAPTQQDEVTNQDNQETSTLQEESQSTNDQDSQQFVEQESSPVTAPETQASSELDTAC